ncbi:signal peptidase II [uncultured Sphingomonas sp.]|uniref:signal peptidase II n=1 Tax=uncultured Sphingomonas sp. TaxID=158754 RepID=UPI0035CB3CD3
MSRIPRLGLLALVLVFAADQLVKWLVTGPLDIAMLGDVKTLLPVFDLRFIPNIGVSLGLLNATSTTAHWMLVALTGVIAIGVLVWMWRERARVDQAALGCVAGGALGNILDRVRLGYVTDYADLHFGEWRPFLVFNLADAAITVGVLVLLVRALLMRDKRPTAEKVNA